MAFAYRALDSAGDMNFGHGAQDFLVDSPEAVGQAVMTRLTLWTGQWWLDLTIGTPWLGRSPQAGSWSGSGLPDAAIRQRIRTTPFVTRILQYQSSYDALSRTYAVTATLLTRFGVTTIAAPVPIPTPLGLPRRRALQLPGSTGHPPALLARR